MTRKSFLAIAILGLLALTSGESRAAEGGAGFYLLGSKASMAGYVPPPGTYFQSDSYYYTGGAEASRALPLGGRVVADLEADAFYQMLTGLWVMPGQVLGGNLGLGAITVIGRKDVNAQLALNPLPISRSAQDNEFSLGDPVLTAVLGWHSGYWHWSVGSLLNVPIGQYEVGQLANIGFNRWAVDTTAAVTFLNPTTGWQVSSAAGFTFNGENPDTDYRTGTEFHVEFAVIKSLSPAFGLGVVGYHYQQVTGDSGSGAVLGAFEGRVTAIGPVMNYNFQLGVVPVSTSLRWYSEFDTKNRLEGNSVLLTVGFPLAVAGR